MDFFKLFTFGNYYEQCFYKYLCASFCIDRCFYSLMGLTFLGHMGIHNIFLKSHPFICLFIYEGEAHARHTRHTGRSELVLPFHHVGLGDQTQVVGLGGKHFDPLSCLTCLWLAVWRAVNCCPGFHPPFWTPKGSKMMRIMSSRMMLRRSHSIRENGHQVRKTRSSSYARCQGYMFQFQHQVGTVITKSSGEMNSLRMISTKRRT